MERPAKPEDGRGLLHELRQDAKFRPFRRRAGRWLRRKHIGKISFLGVVSSGNRSRIAVATTGSANTVPHSATLRFEAISIAPIS